MWNISAYKLFNVSLIKLDYLNTTTVRLLWIFTSKSNSIEKSLKYLFKRSFVIRFYNYLKKHAKSQLRSKSVCILTLKSYFFKELIEKKFNHVLREYKPTFMHTAKTYSPIFLLTLYLILRSSFLELLNQTKFL